LVGDLPNGIEPIISIETYSFFIFLGILGASILLIIFAFIFFFGYFRKSENEREKSIEILHNLDLSKTKESAYLLTHHGRIIATSDRELRIYFELIPLLESYKYKKSVEPFADEVIQKFKVFLEVVESE
jgi:hypothetical protein